MVRRRSLRVAIASYPIDMGWLLVYLAEHYVIDVLAGWAVVVVVSFWLWAGTEHRWERRRSEFEREESETVTLSQARAPGRQEGTTAPTPAGSSRPPR